MTSILTSEVASQVAALEVRGASFGYGAHPVVRDVDVDIRPGAFTVFIGPNASGKSTTLKGLARLLPPLSGSVRLEGRDAADYRPRQYARRLAMLPQAPITPPDVRVCDLVLRGRAPYQSLLRQFSRRDEQVVAEAMRLTGVEELADRRVDELSGGQRQRVWIAVSLAQETPILLLDEPTTYLDLAHQIEVLDLCARLHAEGRTLVVVLHDLNLAARYATDMVLFRDGMVAAHGSPGEVLTAPRVSEVFGLGCDVVPDPRTGTPMIVPEIPPHLR
ncbi:ABC transporter ATP-binding protein [Leucobacter sp. wl10]|uniref:ABC transporter ATP-binding protein n=1 Tax=Leucobacter sp. wl10 TaxID=2304677 RepID=UPI000E5B51A0|nr:ABC transporter ATP-binding protein [Leucobacter sp. wl10]RGE20166.1 ABC transporter ATP-binding protein [Leucobacter sp. wl10]